MQNPQTHFESRVPLDAVICTAELSRRRARPADYSAENRAVMSLVHEMTRPSGNVLQKLVETALDLCRAHSAGVSILEEEDGRKVFRWRAVAGQWSRFLGGTLPRESSPCGTVLDLDSAVLMSHPERHYVYSLDAPPIVEVLLVPFHVAGEGVGTIWIIAHDGSRNFDAEDQRIVTNLGQFASAAYQVLTASDDLTREIAARKQIEAGLRNRAETLLDAQKQALERVVVGAPLTDVLTYLTRIVEQQAEGQAVASILLLDEKGCLRNGASPSLPADYLAAIDGLKADPCVGTCSAAAATGKIVVTPDIAADPQWASIRHLPLGLGFQAAWSNPIVARDGRVLGTFGTYFRERREPTTIELHAVGVLSRTAALAIERKQAEQALRESEERYRAVVESQAEMLCRFRTDGTILFVNGAYARARGMTPEALLGQNFWEFVAPEDRAEVRAMLDRLTPEAPEVRIENRFQTTAGVRWTLWTNRVLRFDAEGRCAEAQSTGIDITERKQAEQALHESEQRFRLMADNSQIIIWLTDASARLRFVNQAFLDFFGIRREQANDFDWMSGLHPDDREPYIGAFMTSLRKRQPFQEQARLRRFDGQWRWFESRGNPILDGDAMTGYVSSALDMTDIHESQQALKELDQRKDEFLANMSHEIRSPLTAIMGYADLLVDRLHDPEDLDHLKTIKRSGDYLIEIVNDILDLSKIEAGKLVLNSEVVSPHALLAEIQGLMELRAREKNLPLILRYDGMVPTSMETDRTRLRQIVINLVSNAIKFTERGRVEIVARFLEGENLLQVEVIDTGIGIAPDDQARLFEPFTQADTSSTRQYGGTGLGLAITRRLVEMLGGNLSFKSEPGQGSAFCVTIPIGPAAAGSRVVNTALSSPPDCAMPADCHVLVVDDSREIRDLIRRFINQAGARATAVADGASAIGAIRSAEASDPIKLVIMDIQMPRIDGYELTRRLRAEGFKRPILALTAYAMKGDREKCHAAGCDDYLSKPIDRDALLQMVARHAQRSGDR